MAVSVLRRMDESGVPLLVARIILGVVMLLMGWEKVGKPVEFLKLIDQYDMFPGGWYVALNLVAVTLPWIEVLGGAMLIVGVFTRGVSLTFLVLLTGFTIAIILRGVGIHATEGIPYRDIHFDCGCGSGDVYFLTKIPENIGLWLLSWFGLLSRSRRFALWSGLAGKAAGNPGVSSISSEPAVDGN